MIPDSVDLNDVDSIRKFAIKRKNSGLLSEDVESIIRKLWVKEKHQGMVRPEVFEIIQSVFSKEYRDFDGETIQDCELFPDSWFKPSKKGSQFISHKCAEDYLRVYPHVVTEYVSGRGTASQFVGDHWLKDAEGLIKTTLENTGIITPSQIRAAVESIENMTRIVDAKKIALLLDQIMQLPAHTIPIDEGLFDLLSKKVLPHSAEFHYTERLPRKYTPGAIVHKGIVQEAESILPAYSLLNDVEKWRGWRKSIVFTTRGCIRK